MKCESSVKVKVVQYTYNKLFRIFYFLDYGGFGVSERDLEKVGQLKTLCNFSCSS